LWFTAGESDIQKKRKMESVAIPEHLIKLLPVAEPGIFDLVGYVISAVEGNPYQSVFYNGNIEVVMQGKCGEAWTSRRRM